MLMLWRAVRMPCVWFAALSCLGASGSVRAQQVVVQQPVVTQFGVETVVSVPDGGRVFLGGVSGAREGRNQGGFSLLGSSLGLERVHQSAHVSVWIHDLEELDRIVLSSGTTLENPWTGVIEQPRSPVPSGSAGTAEHSAPAGSRPGAERTTDFDPRGTAAFRALTTPSRR